SSSVPTVAAMIDLLELEIDVEVGFVGDNQFSGRYGGPGMGGVTERDGMQFYSTSPDLRIDIVKAIGSIGPDAAGVLSKRLNTTLLLGSKKHNRKIFDAANNLTSIHERITECAQDAIQMLDKRALVLRSPTKRMKDAQIELQKIVDSHVAEKGPNVHLGLDSRLAELRRVIITQLRNLLPDAKGLEQRVDQIAKQIWTFRLNFRVNNGLATGSSDYLKGYRMAMQETLARSGEPPKIYADVVAFEKWVSTVKPLKKTISGWNPTAASPPAQSTAKYGGKTFSQWMKMLEDERDPTALLPAVQALTTLSEDGDAKRVAETFFRLMRRYRTRSFSGPDGRPDPRYSLTSTIDAVIWQLPVDVIADALVDELESPNARSREFITWMIEPVVNNQSEFHLVKAEYRAALRDREEAIVKQLIANAKQQTIPALRQYYIDRLVDLRRFVDFHPEKNEEYIPLLQANVKSERFDLLALGTLVELAPETEGLARRVFDECGDGNGMHAKALLFKLGKKAKSLVPVVVNRIDAHPDGSDTYVRWLGLLGADAKEALPTLKKLIEQNTDAVESGEWELARKAIENESPLLLNDNIQRTFRDFMRTPRSVPGGGGGMGGGIF
ncbi:hypothetical protein ACFL2H_06450, partial [Planctomycetota bacterium]